MDWQAVGRAKGKEPARRANLKRKVTERSLLRSMVDRLREGQERGEDPLGEIMDKLLSDARKGDKDALAFIGKYLLGGGKVSLDELYNPPLIRKTRG